jgi:hypothetical protein
MLPLRLVPLRPCCSVPLAGINGSVETEVCGASQPLAPLLAAAGLAHGALAALWRALRSSSAPRPKRSAHLLSLAQDESAWSSRRSGSRLAAAPAPASVGGVSDAYARAVAKAEAASEALAAARASARVVLSPRGIASPGSYVSSPPRSGIASPIRPSSSADTAAWRAQAAAAEQRRMNSPKKASANPGHAAQPAAAPSRTPAPPSPPRFSPTRQTPRTDPRTALLADLFEAEERLKTLAERVESGGMSPLQ